MEFKEAVGLKAYAMAQKNEFLIFSDFFSNGLFRYNFENSKVEFITSFKTDIIRNNYWQACLVDDEIWFIPFRLEERLAIYNMIDGKMEYLEIPFSTRECAYRPFGECYKSGKNLYITPIYYDCMLKICTDTREIYRIDVGIQEFAGYESSISHGSVFYNEKIYICPWNNSKMICFDTKKECSSVICDDIAKRTYECPLIVDEKSIMLIPGNLNKQILKIDLDAQEKNVCDIKNIDRVKDINYETVKIINNKIYCFSEISNKISIIDIASMELECICDINYIGKGINTGWYMSRSTKYGEIVIPSNISTPMLLVNEKGIHQLSLRPEKDYFMKVLRSQMGLD